MTDNRLSASGRIQEDGLPVDYNCSTTSIESIKTYEVPEVLGGEGDAE